jgi:hypothetical protein
LSATAGRRRSAQNGAGEARSVLVTGASGYIGGRLVPGLLERGHRVRCLAWDPRKLEPAPWHDAVEVLRADIAEDLAEDLAGIEVAVFLVHSIGEGSDWVAGERTIAENFRRSAEQAGVRRIVYLGGLGDDDTELTDVRRVVVAADPQQTWEAVCRVGGERGWYRGELLWQARGLLDQLAGGPELRRRRRHPDQLSIGEPVDFWRVEDLEVGRRLVLWAEMRLPGVAWLEWTVEPVDGGSVLVQTARFRPAACSAGPTGTRWPRSTGWCSPAGSTALPATLSRTRPDGHGNAGPALADALPDTTPGDAAGPPPSRQVCTDTDRAMSGSSVGSTAPHLVLNATSARLPARTSASVAA